jgi:hypothetical protein
MLRANHEQLTKTENASTRNPPGDHHGGSSSSSSPFKPDGGSRVSGSQLRPKGAFLEIFAGTARLTAAMRKRHLACCPGGDIQLGSHHGIRRRAQQLAILSWIRAGWIRFVHLGTSCSVFSRARHGIKDSERSKQKERERVGLSSVGSRQKS